MQVAREMWFISVFYSEMYLYTDSSISARPPSCELTPLDQGALLPACGPKSGD